MPCVLGYLASNAMELQVSVNPQEWSQGTPPSLREAGEGRAIVPCALVAAVVAGMVVQMPVASSTCNVHVCGVCMCMCVCVCLCVRGVGTGCNAVPSGAWWIFPRPSSGGIVSGCHLALTCKLFEMHCIRCLVQKCHMTCHASAACCRSPSADRTCRSCHGGRASLAP